LQTFIVLQKNVVPLVVHFVNGYSLTQME